MDYKFAKIARNLLEKKIHRVQPQSSFDLDKFSWVKNVESYTEDIISEVRSVYENKDIINFNDVLPNQRALYQNDSWKSYFLIAGYNKVENHCLHCPKTLEALEHIPGVINAFYSIFEPGVEVPSHRGPYAGILRYHLGLIIPNGDLGIEVDGIPYQWRVGESFIFDDSFSHKAWNRTKEKRVILFVDLERPLPNPLNLFNKMVLKIFENSKAAKFAFGKIKDTQIKH